MEKRSALKFIAVILLFAIQGCQKELHFEEISPIADSSYLSKIYQIEVNGALADTGNIFTYNYDAQKRVVSIIDTCLDIFNFKKTSSYYSYSGADTLPYMSVWHSVYAGVTTFHYDTTIIYHYYDNTGRNMRDSIIRLSDNLPVPYSQMTEVRSYSYNGNAIYGSRTFQTIPSTPVYPDQSDTASTDVSANILHYQNYRYDMLTSTWRLCIVSDFSYDNKPGPFAKLSNFKTFGIFPNGETFVMELPHRNNRLTQNESHNAGGSGPLFPYINYTYSNTYRPDGYIQEMRVMDQPPLPLTYSKFSFIYRSL